METTIYVVKFVMSSGYVFCVLSPESPVVVLLSRTSDGTKVLDNLAGIRPPFEF